MSEKNGSQSAFPQHGWTKNPEILEQMKNQGGMTKREVMAMHVMASMMGAFSADGNWTALECEKDAAKQAVKAADALLEALG